jgi:hypothetical protein
MIHGFYINPGQIPSGLAAIDFSAEEIVKQVKR